MLRVISKSAHFVNVNFFLLRGTHVIVTKKGLKIYLFNKKTKSFKGKPCAGWIDYFFALNIALFSSIYVLIQFILDFLFC